MKTTIGVRPVGDNILVDIFDDGSQTVLIGGKPFLLVGDDRFGAGTIYHNSTRDHKHPGIRPRWALVVATSDYAEESGLEVGQKILIDTMKWSRGVVYDKDNRRKTWRVHPDDVLMIDEDGLTKEEQEYVDSKRTGPNEQ